MIKEAGNLSKWSKNVVVKISMTKEGIKAVKILSKENIKTNVTLIFSISQALMAIKAGAAYISPFVGRLEDIGTDSFLMIKNLREIIDFYGYKTQIMSASIRTISHIEKVLEAKTHIATIPDKLFSGMLYHPLTDIGIVNFKKDWEKFTK